MESFFDYCNHHLNRHADTKQGFLNRLRGNEESHDTQKFGDTILKKVYITATPREEIK
mgnify:CR=1 FL=1